MLPRIAAAALVLASATATRADPGGTCSGTLTGAVRATFACRATAADADGKVSVVIEPDGKVPGVAALVPARLELPRLPPRGAPVRAQGQSSVENAAGARWAAAAGQGELTLTLQQVERYPQLPGRYVIGGTLEARLVPAGKGAQGEVKLSVTF